MARTPRNYDGTKTTGKLISQVLPEMMQALGERVKERPDEVLKAWPGVVGELHASMSKAVSFESGILKVKVKNSSSHSVLSQKAPDLLRNLREKFPYATIKKILFSIG